MTGKALVLKRNEILDNLLTSLFCGLSNFNVDGLHVPLLQNGGCILNTQPIAANDYCGLMGYFGIR
jgi:hypothetical protein